MRLIYLDFLNFLCLILSFFSWGKGVEEKSYALVDNLHCIALLSKVSLVLLPYFFWWLVRVQNAKGCNM